MVFGAGSSWSVVFLRHELANLKQKRNKGKAAEDEKPVEVGWRIKHLLTIIATAKKCVELDEILGGLLVLAHHPVLGKHGLSLWTTLLQQNGISPPVYVGAHYPTLKKSIWASFAHDSNEQKQAAFNALATLALVAPTLVLVDVVTEIKSLLDASNLSQFSATDFAIYQHTASDIPYVDVLALAKPKQVASKGKDQAIQKWEDDVRKSLQSKGSASGKAMTKPEKALVESQLRKEADIRAAMQSTFDRIRIGLSLIDTLLQSGLDIASSNAIPEIMSSLLPLFQSPYASKVEGPLQATWSALATFSLAQLPDIASATAAAILFAVRSTVLLDPAQNVPGEPASERSVALLTAR
jgi:hypothetical protein